MTLLERWDLVGFNGEVGDEIRRAIAIAQAVEEWHKNSDGEGGFLLRRAEELLRGEK